MRSGLDFAHQATDVLAGVTGELHDFALPHALSDRSSHGNGKRGASILGALLGSRLGAHCLLQALDGLSGGGHTCMFAHRGGHMKEGAAKQPSIGHMNVASWVCQRSRRTPMRTTRLSKLTKAKGHHHMAVSKRLRYEVLRRDNHACRYCGATAPDVKLNVDHVIPQALGGSDAPTNLVTACADCNGGKTSSMPNAMPVADVEQDAFRQAAALKRKEEERVKAIWLHMYLTWVWAYEKSGRTPTEQECSWVMQETNKLLACGYSAHVDLTEGAFQAGLNTDLAIAPYIKLPNPRTSLRDQRFVNTVHAVSEWESAWDYETLAGDPTVAQTSTFVETVKAALAAGHTRESVLKAAQRAGTALSTDVTPHLPKLLAQRGEH